MPQQAEPQGQRTGLFVNPAAPRRAQFQAEAGSRFASLALADGAEAALELLGRGPVDLLVIDIFSGARTPAHVTSIEFYRSAVSLLKPGVPFRCMKCLR